jgi:hypothetical protein
MLSHATAVFSTLFHPAAHMLRAGRTDCHRRYVSHSAAILVLETPSDQEPIAGLFEMGHVSPPWALGVAEGLGVRTGHVSMAIVQRNLQVVASIASAMSDAVEAAD